MLNRVLDLKENSNGDTPGLLPFVNELVRRDDLDPSSTIDVPRAIASSTSSSIEVERTLHVSNQERTGSSPSKAAA